MPVTHLRLIYVAAVVKGATDGLINQLARLRRKETVDAKIKLEV